MKQNFEKMETKKRPRVNPRVAVNMGKCAACPLVNLCQAARLKRPDIVNDDNCQAVVEHMESDLGGGEYLPSTKEQFSDNSRNMVFATDLHRVPSQKQNIEKQKRLERIAAEKNTAPNNSAICSSNASASSRQMRAHGRKCIKINCSRRKRDR